ncbi:MAG: hypothetical protein QG553_205 [Patescibacteria group bacterium]|nr:hypothetical protein [Patescibacteria group bacterium]
MVGYPGAGKTTAAQILHNLTGAEHLWADHIRKEQFQAPTYSQQESNQLYEQMNKQTEALLKQGKSVIFDTNFNFYKDRQKLRQIAELAAAKTVLIWVQAPRQVAKQRATTNAHQQDSRVLGNMTDQDFDRLSNHLEEPQPDEHAIVLDGTNLTKEQISSAVLNN